MADWTLTGTSTVTLPRPATAGVSRPISIVGATHTSLGGDVTVQIMARKIVWTLNFGDLTDDEYDLLLQFRDGRQGDGPFTLVDPRDDDDVTHLVNIPLDSGLTDDSALAGYRTGVVMSLGEV